MIQQASFHPLQFVASLRERGFSNLRLSFSRYLYRPQSPFDEREIFAVGIREVTSQWFDRQRRRLRDNWELALNSNVLDVRSRTLHMPMIDFVAPSLDTAAYLRMREILGHEVCDALEFFASGRSFHAYGSRLLTPGEWREFMGKLLLLNLPKQEELVDTRWVGHRLLSGYSALRWSSNSTFYVAMPRKIELSALLVKSKLET